MFKNSILISIFLFQLIFVTCKEKPIVTTTHGDISGKILKTLIRNVDYYAFMGIPFAAPPVGDLRFMPPQPIDPWDGTLSTTKEKPACIQYNNDVKKGQGLGKYGVEDCLYLDIFTPSLIDDKKNAVIVFINNVHFLNSYNKTKDYEPDFFVEEDVVVVTISHRLSVFGFLSLEDETLPGNAGLKDIVAGLQWVRDNIEKFGGDPEQITMMGLQGGAAAVDLLMHSKAKNMFQAVILQSGTSWTSGYLQADVRERAFRLGELLNITTTSGKILLKDLQQIEPSLLLSKELHASPPDYFKDTQRSVVTFGPIVEKQPDGLITEYPEDSTEKIDKPIMIGFNSREGLEGTLHYLLEPRYMMFLKKDFPLLLPRRLNFKFDPLEDSYYSAAEEVKHFYLPNGEIKLTVVPDIVTLFGDIMTNYGVDYTAKVYANRSSEPVYYYHFDYYSALNENKNNIMKISTVEDGTWGAATGDEMCYLFKCPSLKNEYLKYDKSMSEERIIQRKMIKLWTNFAKYGNPTPGKDYTLGGLKWRPYTIENKEYLNIDKDIDMKNDLYKKRFQFWDEFLGKWEGKAVNRVVSESINKRDEL